MKQIKQLCSVHKKNVTLYTQPIFAPSRPYAKQIRNKNLLFPIDTG